MKKTTKTPQNHCIHKNKKKPNTPDTWKQSDSEYFRTQECALHTYSKQGSHWQERRFSCTGEEENLPTLKHSALDVRRPVIFGCNAQCRLVWKGQFSVAGRKAVGHSSLELYRSLARAEQCASTHTERARGRGVWSPRPALSNIEPPWLPCVLPVRSNAGGNIGTLLRVCHLSQLKTFIQDGHERNSDSQFVSF